MKTHPPATGLRGDFVRTIAKGTAAASTLALSLSAVHAQGSDQIKIALIGCGGRGGGAAKNALSVNKGGVALLDAIRNDQPHNEVKRGVEASVVCNMGRMATHTGQEITFDEALNHEHDYAPNIASLTADGPAPLMPDAKGRYPKPEPGHIINREYAESAV